jgi:hypothetical protein
MTDDEQAASVIDAFTGRLALHRRRNNRGKARATWWIFDGERSALYGPNGNFIAYSSNEVLESKKRGEYRLWIECSVPGWFVSHVHHRCFVTP